MKSNNFTSGPIRPFSMEEIGTSSFSDYTLLSDSGHNVVYRAMRDGKWWVMKAAKRQEGDTAKNQLLLQREFDIMHQLDCIYIVHAVQIIDDTQLGKAILMEYVDGRTLNEFLAERPSMSQRKQVLHELLEALTYLHQKGVVHGDLKPDNVLITTNGNHVRLIDFGFADDDSFPAKNIGATALFSAPEMARGESPHPSRQASKDIYSLGILLKSLFPRRYQSIHKRCVHPEPQKRPQSIAQVGRAIHCNDLLSWLLPVLLGLLVISVAGLSVVPSVSNIDQPRVADTIVHRDTIVIAPIPVDASKDSILNLAKQRYQQLFTVYMDSIQSIPDSSYMRAFDYHTRYAEAMYNALQHHLAKHPEYSDEINDGYLIIYSRDLPRIVESYKNYKFE